MTQGLGSWDDLVAYVARLAADVLVAHLPDYPWRGLPSSRPQMGCGCAPPAAEHAGAYP